MPFPSPNLLPGDDVDTFRPTVQEIGALLHDRTTIDGGSEAGTFLDADDEGGPTDPTAAQVERLITVALNQIAIQVPDDLTDKQNDYARTLVAYQAAILVENSHFSDQVQNGDSLAAMYQQFLDAGLLTLASSVDGNVPGGPSAFSIGTPTDHADSMFDRVGRRSHWGGW
jgi:hypothetical protein